MFGFGISNGGRDDRYEKRQVTNGQGGQKERRFPRSFDFSEGALLRGKTDCQASCEAVPHETCGEAEAGDPPPNQAAGAKESPYRW